MKACTIISGCSRQIALPIEFKGCAYGGLKRGHRVIICPRVGATRLGPALSPRLRPPFSLHFCALRKQTAHAAKAVPICFDNARTNRQRSSNMTSYAYRDQENLVHGHQTAAALKPLNNGAQGLAPKTPSNNGPKTATIPLKSENKTNKFNSKFGNYAREDENTQLGGKSGKADRFAFVTPLAPRDRAPLGAKTTNAQAIAFRTPAPLTQGTQLRSTSNRKAKLKIHRAEASEAEAESTCVEKEESDIEYCPRKIAPLPDNPDEDRGWGLDMEFPMFAGQNKFHGWFSHFGNPIGEDGLSKWERDGQKQCAKIEKSMDEKINAGVEKSLSELSGFSRKPKKSQVTSNALEKIQGGHARNVIEGKQKTTARLGPFPPGQISNHPSYNLDAGNAAQALSQRSRSNFAVPTATSKAKTVNSFQSNSSSQRHTPGSVASRTTIGFARGRKVSSALKKAVDTSKSILTSPETKEDSTDLDDEVLDELEDILHNTVRDDGCQDVILSNSQSVDQFFQNEAEKDFILELPEH